MKNNNQKGGAAAAQDTIRVSTIITFDKIYPSGIAINSAGELFIIDQHALYERIRYERLRQSMVDWSPQELIIPIPISLGVRELAAARSESDRLSELGFEFSELDEVILVTSVPAVLLGDNSLTEFIHDILIDISSRPESNGVDTVEKLRDKVAFMRSCRGSVKANQKLNLSEMRRLLLDMRTVPNPWACVHGRPTILRLTQVHMDKHFGRHG